MRLMILALCSVVAAACTKSTPPAAPVDPKATIRFVTPGDGEVAPIVKQQLERAAKENRQVLVYTGAAWCEPCRAFHQAVDKGELTGKVGAIDIVGFDADYDAERMLMAGYESQMIPMFAVPGPDGRASGRQMEGGTKGTNAADEFAPRLRALLASKPVAK